MSWVDELTDLLNGPHGTYWIKHAKAELRAQQETIKDQQETIRVLEKEYLRTRGATTDLQSVLDDLDK